MEGNKYIKINLVGIPNGIKRNTMIRYGVSSVKLSDYYDIVDSAKSGIGVVANISYGFNGNDRFGADKTIRIYKPYISGSIELIDYAIYRVRISIKVDDNKFRRVCMFNLIYDGDRSVVVDKNVIKLMHAMSYDYSFVYLVDEDRLVMGDVLMFFDVGSSYVPIVYQIRVPYSILYKAKYSEAVALDISYKIAREKHNIDNVMSSVSGFIDNFVDNFGRYFNELYNEGSIKDIVEFDGNTFEVYIKCEFDIRKLRNL